MMKLQHNSFSVQRHTAGGGRMAGLAMGIQRVFSLADLLAKVTHVLAPVVRHFEMLHHVPIVNGHFATD
jgi:hypothetical protein